jgi:hypothetical protein
MIRLTAVIDHRPHGPLGGARRIVEHSGAHQPLLRQTALRRTVAAAVRRLSYLASGAVSASPRLYSPKSCKAI